MCVCVCVCVCVCKGVQASMLMHKSKVANMSQSYLQRHQSLSQMQVLQSREVGQRIQVRQPAAVLELILLPSGVGVAAVTQVHTLLTYCDTGTHTSHLL